MPARRRIKQVLHSLSSKPYNSPQRPQKALTFSPSESPPITRSNSLAWRL
jgi:hypothetical protein